MWWRRTRSGSQCVCVAGRPESSLGDAPSDPRGVARAEDEEESVARRTSYASIRNGSCNIHYTYTCEPIDLHIIIVNGGFASNRLVQAWSICAHLRSRDTASCACGSRVRTGTREASAPEFALHYTEFRIKYVRVENMRTRLQMKSKAVE